MGTIPSEWDNAILLHTFIFLTSISVSQIIYSCDRLRFLSIVLLDLIIQSWIFIDFVWANECYISENTWLELPTTYVVVQVTFDQVGMFNQGFSQNRSCKHIFDTNRGACRVGNYSSFVNEPYVLSFRPPDASKEYPRTGSVELPARHNTVTVKWQVQEHIHPATRCLVQRLDRYVISETGYICNINLLIFDLS